MIYVKGHTFKKVGNLLAKVNFEGVVEELVNVDVGKVKIHDTVLSITQFTIINNCSVNEETKELKNLFSLKPKRRCKKHCAANTDEFKEEFQRQLNKWEDVLTEALKDAKRYKHIVPEHLIERAKAIKDNLMSEFRFAEVLDSPTKKQVAIDNVLSSYVSVIYDVDNCKTARQSLREMGMVW